jgi:hypothetical protein
MKKNAMIKRLISTKKPEIPHNSSKTKNSDTCSNTMLLKPVPNLKTIMTPLDLINKRLN